MRSACNDSTFVPAEPYAWFLRQAVASRALPVACLIIAGTAQARAETSCSDVKTSFAVMAEHYQPVIKSSFTSEELRILASKAPRKSPHPPLGFYAGTFGYKVEIVAQDAQQCALAVTVRLLLTPRLIEIGSDGPCKPDVVAEHYLLHARQDDLLLNSYAEQARGVLDNLQLANPLRDQDVTAGDAVVRSVRAALDRLLQPYDEERQHALAAADTAEALTRLNQGCGRAT